MKNIKENITNLTALWQTVGATCGEFYERENYSYSMVSQSQWPNRIWLIKSATSPIVADLTQLILSIEPPMSVSYWADFEDPTFAYFDRGGFVLKSEQIGMSLELPSEKFKLNKRVSLQKIATAQQAEQWERLYPQSFGYVISAQSVTHTKDKINYYLIYDNDTPIGTVMTFHTGSVIGIHGMGIFPDFRKQGFAEEVMLLLLNQAIDEHKTLVTLQASTMGRNIYSKIGFSEDFLIRNYEYDI